MARPPSSALTDYWRVPGTAGSHAAAVLGPVGRLELREAPPNLESDPGITVELSLSLRALAGELQQEREWRDRLANGIMPIEVPAIGAFTPAQTPYLQGTWGPKDGFAWAVQRITAGQLLPTDTMQLYRGTSTADASGNQNLLQGFQGQAGAVQAWTPGRTGCMLAANQRIIITGVLSGGPYMLNADVIQVESWLVPYFLL